VDWSHIDFLNMFTDAINERNMIFGAVSSPNYFVVGDDLQVGRSQVGVDTSRSVFGLQGRVSSLAANRWLDCTRSLQLETDTALYGSTQLRLINFNEVLCAMRGTVWDGNRDTPMKFRRKKERTILSVSDTTDTDGNAIADGMRARLVYNSTPLPADQNKVFARTAGAWTLSLDYLPGDTLDSMSAAPDHCAYGGIVPGDYLGIWLGYDYTYRIEDTASRAGKCTRTLVYILSATVGSELIVEVAVDPGRFAQATAALRAKCERAMKSKAQPVQRVKTTNQDPERWDGLS
jgi:hypothetical protein